jgi:hypothetical protein
MRSIPKIAAGILVLLLSAGAHAQSPAVHQTGQVTRGHLSSWANPGLIQDGGGALNGNLQSLGIVPVPLSPIPPFCINDALISSFSGYHQLCIDADDGFGDGGLLLYGPIGGATNDPLTLQSGNVLALNSNIQQIVMLNLPATVAGDVRVCVNPATGQLYQASAMPTDVLLTDENNGAILTDENNGALLVFTISAGQCAP